MTDATDAPDLPPADLSSPEAPFRATEEATLPTEPTELDDRALALRRQSKGFGKIAQVLGLSRASDANEAFNRALRRRSPEEQAVIRVEENGRLDRLREAVTADDHRTTAEVEKRLRAIERLRTRLMSG